MANLDNIVRNNERPAGGRALAACLPVVLAACAGLPSTGKVPALPDPDRWVKVQDVTMVRQTGRADCGSAALAMMLARWNAPARLDELRGTLGPADDKRGIAAGRLRDTARARGMNAFLIEGTIDDLLHEVRRGRPVMVGLVRVTGGKAYPHYEVVAGVNQQDGELLLADPAEGWRKERLDRFTSRWKPARNLALVMWPKDGDGAGVVDARPGSRQRGGPPVAAHDQHRQQAD